MVLLHGIESSSSYWKGLIPQLSKKYRVITIDLLGFGESPKPHNIAYSLDDQVMWLKRTLNFQGIKKFKLLGHSLGALVAMAYAAKYPKEVTKLYLISPVIFNASEEHNNILIKKFTYIEKFSDTGYLVSTISKTVGTKKIAKFIPAIRSASNAIKHQNTLELAKRMKDVATTIIYGDKDRLVDPDQLQAVVKRMRKVKVIKVSKGTHNFPLNQPDTLLQVIQPGIKAAMPKKIKSQPNRVIRQLFKLAVPILLVKSLLYIAAGLLLFSQYKEETLVAGVALLVVVQSYQFIRGSFSLKNEGLAYIGYFSLGLLGILLGVVLTNHFHFSLKLALIIVCGYVFVNGLSRLIAGTVWTTDKTLRRTQLLSGIALFLVSIAAFFGSLTSVYVIVYAIAGYLLVRGLIFGFYVIVSLIAAYSRGYY